MPFAASYEDEEKKNQEPGQGINISGGAGANFATGVPGQDAGVGDKKSSGQYANIQSYLDANKDQADQMGSTIASNVSQKADDATTKIQSFEAKAPKVEAYDPNAAYSNLGKLTDDQKNQYRTQKQTGGYSGPQNVDQVEGYDDFQKSANEAAGLVKSAGTETGQQELLKNTYKRPDYTAGQNKLDQVLLQNSSGSKQALEGLSQKYSGLSSIFDQANQKVGTALNDAQTQALKNKEAIAAGEKSQWDNLVNPIQARANQMNIDNPALYGRVNNDAADEILNDETLGLLGLSEGQNLYDLNLQSYLSPNLSQVGLNEAANSDERSRYQALSDLVGDPSRNQINANGKAIKPVGFDLNRFNTDVNAKNNEYQTQYNTAKVADFGGTLGALTPAQLKDAVAEYRQRASETGSSYYSGKADQMQSAYDNWEKNFNINRKVKKG